MGTITTTSSTTPLIWPSTTRIDRSPVNGHLYAMIKATAANTYELWRSTDAGANWSLHVSLVRASIVDVGSIQVLPAPYNQLVWCYRTNESSEDRIYIRTIGDLGATSPAWNAELLVAAAGNGGVAGAVYTGLDVATTAITGVAHLVAVAAGTQSGSLHGVSMHVAAGDTLASLTVRPFGVAGTRQWLHTGSGRITPSLDLEHSGDGKSSGAPHLWVGWGRTDLYSVKLGWTGGGWSGPTAALKVNDDVLTPAQDSISARWDGNRWLLAVPHPTSTSTVLVFERDRANSKTTERITPTHPAGVVRNCAVSYNTVNGDFRVYAVGTSSTVLYFVDFARATGLWTSWAQVSATAILGATGNNYSVRRSSAGNAKYDVLTAHATPTPNTIIHTAQPLSYPPDVPTWVTVDGQARDVSATLALDWSFSDPDPADAQTAYAISRQIGAGALSYWRASDSTWQAAEVKNTSATSLVTLAAAWGLTSDAPHTYRVKVWDGADVASLYSTGLVVIPSGKVSPTITAPTEGQVLTGDTLTVSWTVAEQSAYRVKLQVLSTVVHDTGWVAGTATSVTIPSILADGFSYSVFLQTRNLKGLESNNVQVNFSVNFVTPAVATVVLTPQPELGLIRAVITNPTPVGAQPAFVSQELHRRPFTKPYIRQYNFEDVAEMAEWAAPFGGTAARSNAQAHKGSWSYRLTPDGVTFVALVETVKLPAVAGVEYFLDAWIRGATANKPVWMQLRWFDAADVSLGAANGFIQDPPAAAGAWEYRWVNGLAPANTAKMSLAAIVDLNPAVGDIIDVDEVRVRETDRTGSDVLIASGLPANATYDDWQAVSGVEYEYMVVVQGANQTRVGGPWNT